MNSTLVVVDSPPAEMELTETIVSNEDEAAESKAEKIAEDHATENAEESKPSETQNQTVESSSDNASSVPIGILEKGPDTLEKYDDDWDDVDKLAKDVCSSFYAEIENKTNEDPVNNDAKSSPKKKHWKKRSLSSCSQKATTEKNKANVTTSDSSELNKSFITIKVEPPDTYNTESPRRRGQNRVDAFDGIKHVPFTKGWKREIVTRGTVDAGGKRQRDVYYYAPDGTKLRSMVEIGKYLEAHPGSGVSLENFTFFREPIYHPPQEMTRQAVKRSAETNNSVSSPKASNNVKQPSANSALKRSPTKRQLAPTAEKPPSSPKKPKQLQQSLPPKKAFKTEPQLTTPKIIVTIKKGTLAGHGLTSQVKVVKRPKVKYTPSLAASKGKDFKGTSPSDDVQKKPKNSISTPLSPDRPPCSVFCSGQIGQIPTLMCKTCLCMFHPACVNFADKPSLFECKQCKKSKEHIAAEDVTAANKNRSPLVNGNANTLSSPTRTSKSTRNELGASPITSLSPEIILDAAKSPDHEVKAKKPLSLKIKYPPILPDTCKASQINPPSCSSSAMCTAKNVHKTGSITTTVVCPPKTTASTTRTDASQISMTVVPKTSSPSTVASVPTNFPVSGKNKRNYARKNTVPQPVPPPLLLPCSSPPSSSKVQVRMIRPPPGTRMPVNSKPGQSITFLTRSTSIGPVLPSPLQMNGTVVSPVLPSPPPLRPAPSVRMNHYMVPPPASSATQSATISANKNSDVQPVLMVNNNTGLSQGYIVVSPSPTLQIPSPHPSIPQPPPPTTTTVILPPPPMPRLTSTPLSPPPMPLPPKRTQSPSVRNTSPNAKAPRTCDNVKPVVSSSTVPLLPKATMKSAMPADEAHKMHSVIVSHGTASTGQTPDGSTKGPKKKGSMKKLKLRKAALATNKPMEKMMCCFESLLKIFQYLRLPDLLRVSQVCKTWKKIAMHPCFWEKIYLRGVYIKDWNNFARILTRHGTSVLDCQGMIEDEETWKKFKGSVQEFRTVDHLIFDNIPPEIFQDISKALPHLESVIATDICALHKKKESETSGSIQAASLNISHLCCLKRLKKLSLRSSRGISVHSEGLQKYLKMMSALQYLRHLSLTSLKFVTSDDLICLEELKHLNELELGDCAGWDNMAFNALAKLKKLRYLRLENGGDIPDRGLAEALCELKCLEELHLVLFRVASNLGETLKKMTSLKRLTVWPIPYREIMPEVGNSQPPAEPMEYPCGGCNMEVQDNQRGLQCEACLKWYHARCGLVSAAEYRRLGRSSDSWICPKCDHDVAFNNKEMQGESSSEDKHFLAVAVINHNTLVSVSEAQQLEKLVWGVVSSYSKDNDKVNDNIETVTCSSTQTATNSAQDQNSVLIPMLGSCRNKTKDAAAATSDTLNIIEYLKMTELRSRLINLLPNTKTVLVVNSKTVLR